MPALPPEQSGKAAGAWANRDRSPDSSIRFTGRTQRILQQEWGVQEFLQKCRNRRRLRDPHGDYAGSSPGPHRGGEGRGGR